MTTPETNPEIEQVTISKAEYEFLKRMSGPAIHQLGRDIRRSKLQNICHRLGHNFHGGNFCGLYCVQCGFQYNYQDRTHCRNIDRMYDESSDSCKLAAEEVKTVTSLWNNPSLEMLIDHMKDKWEFTEK
jgi:hypothetical protein